MVADLDKAAELLDGKGMAAGRASKLAALALKSRILCMLRVICMTQQKLKQIPQH